MDRDRIRERLKLSVLNVTLATLSKQDGDLKDATEALYKRVEEIVKQAQREAVSAKTL